MVCLIGWVATSTTYFINAIDSDFCNPERMTEEDRWAIVVAYVLCLFWPIFVFLTLVDTIKEGK